MSDPIVAESERFLLARHLDKWKSYSATQRNLVTISLIALVHLYFSFVVPAARELRSQRRSVTALAGLQEKKQLLEQRLAEEAVQYASSVKGLDRVSEIADHLNNSEISQLAFEGADRWLSDESVDGLAEGLEQRSIDKESAALRVTAETWRRDTPRADRLATLFDSFANGLQRRPLSRANRRELATVLAQSHAVVEMIDAFDTSIDFARDQYKEAVGGGASGADVNAMFSRWRISTLNKIEINPGDNYSDFGPILSGEFATISGELKSKLDAGAASLRKAQGEIAAQAQAMANAIAEADGRIQQSRRSLDEALPLWAKGLISAIMGVRLFPAVLVAFVCVASFVSWRTCYHFDRVRQGYGLHEITRTSPLATTLWTLVYRGRVATAASVAVHLGVIAVVWVMYEAASSATREDAAIVPRFVAEGTLLLAVAGVIWTVQRDWARSQQVR